MTETMDQRESCLLLKLPTEIRLEIWKCLFSPPQHLIMRSLFIRTYYRTVFMSQQPKKLACQLLRVCKTITEELLPILYGLPHWRASCRFESLASQISIRNFCLIRRMTVDVDDLPSIVGSLLLDIQEQKGDSHSPGRQTTNSVELKLELESRALLENMISSNSLTASRPLPGGMVTPWTPMQRRLKFSNLELLEVDGYQSMAFTSRGTRKSRLEGLRLCKFAAEILAYHPALSVLVQADHMTTGGSDAVDLYMARVKWRFLRDASTISDMEHIVNLPVLERSLKDLIEYEENKEGPRRSSWTQTGRFQQYPYLMQTAP